MTMERVDPSVTKIENPDARKFLFDLSFDDDLGRLSKAAERKRPIFTQEQVDAACEEARRVGHAEGMQAAGQSQQQSMNLLLMDIERRLAAVMEESNRQVQDQTQSFQHLALAIAKKILPSYAARHGLGEIASILSKVFAEMGREPRLVFRVCEAQFDEAKARIETLAAQTAYAGKLVILGDPEIGMSECRIEWADGGIERDMKKLWQDIDRVLGETHETALPTIDTESKPQATPAPMGDES